MDANFMIVFECTQSEGLKTQTFLNLAMCSRILCGPLSTIFLSSYGEKNCSVISCFAYHSKKYVFTTKLSSAMDYGKNKGHIGVMAHEI